MSALLAGSIAVNDFGYDGPAMWIKMVAPVPTSRLLLARHWAHMCLSALVTVVFAIIILVIHGITSVTMMVCFVSIGVLMVSAALSLLLTAFNPYPVAPPGTSPWADKSGYSGAAFIAVFALMFLGWVPVAPGVVLFFLGYHVLCVVIALVVSYACFDGLFAVF